jgi:hypothetical protein
MIGADFAQRDLDANVIHAADTGPKDCNAALDFSAMQDNALSLRGASTRPASTINPTLVGKPASVPT